jgi:PKD repeat protein
MKNYYLFLLFFILCVNIQSQPSQQMWDYRYGGSKNDIPHVLVKCLDSGFLLCGNSSSTVGYEKSDTVRGGSDYWIVKTDNNGVFQWDKTYGGLGNEFFVCALALPDSGFILGGYSGSGIGGDKTENNRDTITWTTDYWIIRIDKFGNKIWDRTYGGTNSDLFRAIIRFSDNTFLLGGFTFSDSAADMSHHNYGNFDYLVIKIDANGNKIWDNNYGGAGGDFLSDLCATSNDGFIVGGWSSSQANIWKSQSPYNNLNDYWILKFDAAGNKLWDKIYGGDSSDYLSIIKLLPGDSLLLGGFSFSGMSFDKSENNHGGSSADLWLIKTDSSGNKIWDRSLGGNSAEDDLGNIEITMNNNICLFGTSYSNVSGDKSENNTLNIEQPWAIEITSSGVKVWDKTLNLYTHSEFVEGIERNGCYIFLTYVDNDGGHVTQSRNTLRDFWMTEFCPSIPIVTFTTLTDTICQNSCVSFINNSQNGNTYQWIFPGGTPSFSTSMNPPDICYNSAGQFDVTLIVTNSLGTDTVKHSNYITVLPQVPFMPIDQHGDSLISMPGYFSYQWFYDTIPIAGANSNTYMATQSGDYSVLITDTNGCTAVAKKLNVIASMENDGFEKNIFALNYQNENLNILSSVDFTTEILLYDLSGKRIFSKLFHLQKGKNTISLTEENLNGGIYFVSIINYNSKLFFKIFIN